MSEITIGMKRRARSLEDFRREVEGKAAVLAAIEQGAPLQILGMEGEKGRLQQTSSEVSGMMQVSELSTSEVRRTCRVHAS